MKGLLLVGILCLPLGLSAQQAVPQLPIHATADFLKLPQNLYLGEVAGVAINSKGHLFVLSRGNTTGPAYAAAELLEFNADGTYIREIGHNLYAWSFAHAVKVDKQDNIWVTDKGSDMVIKFNPEGRVIMVFGRKQEASDEGTEALKHTHPPLPPVDGQFRQVTDVTWDAAGNTYISDGYINSRVAKVDKDGNWIKSFGEPGSGPGQFLQPHSIATGPNGEIFVADRGNRRIQIFDTDGKYLREIHIDVPYDHALHPWMGNMPSESAPEPTNKSMQNGAPWAICITRGPNPVLFASDGYPGRVYKMKLDGTVLGTFGQTGRQPGQFGWIHEIACPSDHELYVAELLNWRLQKIVVDTPVTSSSSGKR
jgi:DNA-binding beta-propeller fold protein YncE